MPIGFAPDEITTAEPTRFARLKWVVVVNADLPPSIATNTAICVAAATSREVTGLAGPDGRDADGGVHPGLPWAGCSVLTASSQELTRLRERVIGAEDVFVADTPAGAQWTRVYDEYLGALAGTAADVQYFVVRVVGPREQDRRTREGPPAA